VTGDQLLQETIVKPICNLGRMGKDIDSTVHCHASAFQVG
jgi:hypothetical protein